MFKMSTTHSFTNRSLRRGAASILFSLLSLTPLVAASSGTAWVTPHESYSSSVGVLGCKVNTDRIAYWPNSIDCTNLCVELSYQGRTVHLLRIDRSEGAHDVSYDAWNYLYTGYSATEKPAAGGATAMEYKDVDISHCADLIYTDDGKMPFSAANSMNFIASCLDQTESWVGNNYVLYNILDPICLWGNDERCDLDWPAANQAACPHPLGTPSVLEDTPVWNVQYPTGKRVKAGAPPEMPVVGDLPPAPEDDAGVMVGASAMVVKVVSGIVAVWLLC